MSRNHLLTLRLVSCVLCLCAVLFLFTGCESLRFQPSQEQKQIALDAYVISCHIVKQGTEPASPEAIRLVSDTQANLSYIGPPANSYGLKGLEDYPATLAKAESDAIKRPDANDIFAAAEQGLSLAAQLAILFGFGGVGVGGKKVFDLIAIARQKSKALEEIVKGSQTFLDSVSADQKQDFKAAQKQSPTTKTLVTQIKATNS